MMEWYIGAVFVFGVLLLLVLAGLPVAFSLGVISLLGLLVIGQLSLLPAMAHIAWGATNVFVLTAVAGFLLMSELISATGLSRRVFNAVYSWLGQLPGSLAVVTVWVCALFGAVSGTGVGVAAIVGLIAIPEMKTRGYETKLTTGTVAASSALGMVIPPSLPLIVYGVVTELSVGRLFIAGIIPGLITAAVYSTYILIKTMRKPALAPRSPLRASWKERFATIPGVGPTAALIIVVIGGIYAGVFTPTEAAGFGAFGAMLIALGYRKLTFPVLWSAVKSSTVTTCMIMMIIVGAMLFGYLLAVMQIPQGLSAWVTELGVSRWIVFAAIHLCFLVLGMFLEVTSIILITMPIFYPVALAMGFDPIWFGIVMMINMCAAVVSPPMGLCVYVVKGIAPEVEVGDIFRGALPYIGLVAVVILVLIAFPDLVTWLPNQMMG